MGAKHGCASWYEYAIAHFASWDKHSDQTPTKLSLIICKVLTSAVGLLQWMKEHCIDRKKTNQAEMRIIT